MGEVVDFPSFGKIHFSIPTAVLEAVQEMKSGDSLHIDGLNNREVPLKLKINKLEEHLDFYVDSEQSVLDASSEHWTFVLESVSGAMYLVTGQGDGSAPQEDMNIQYVDPSLEITQEFVHDPNEPTVITDEDGNITAEMSNMIAIGPDGPLDVANLDSVTIEHMQTEHGVTVIDPAILEKIQSMQNISVSETDAVTAMVRDSVPVTAIVTPTLDLDTLASAAAAGMNMPGDGTTQILVSKDEATGMEQVVITRSDGVPLEILATDEADITDPDYEPELLAVKDEEDGEQIIVNQKARRRAKGGPGTVMHEVPIKTSDVTTFKCYGCNSAYLDLAVLNRHFSRKHHGQLDATKVETSVLANAHICFLCNAATSCMKGFQSHLERVHKVKYVRRAAKKTRNRKSNRRSRLDPGAAVAYCTLCDVKRGFLYTMNLVYHIRKYHANNPGYHAAHKAAMDLHFERYKHKCLVQVYCELCNDLYYGSAVITHIDKVHNDLPPEELAEVKRRAKGAIARGYLERAKIKKRQTAECPKCHEKMTINYLRNIHIARCTGTPMRRRSNGGKGKPVRKLKKWTGPTPCQECGKVFDTRISFNQHMRNIHFKTIRVPVTVVSCEICSRQFATKAKLERHMSSHTQERPFECEVCHKRYKTADVLGDHQRIVHRRQYRNKCKFCDYSHDRKVIVTKHEETCQGNPQMKQEDTQEMEPNVQFAEVVEKVAEPLLVVPVEIAQAEKKEREMGGGLEEGEVPMGDEEQEEGEITTWRAPHPVGTSSVGPAPRVTGGPPFKCPECNKLLKTKSGLYNHRRQQHHVTYRQPLTLFQCHICDKTFVSKHKLKMHMLSHTGEKLAECKECNKKFRDAYTLKDHIEMVHMNIYKFNCKHCKQGFDKIDRLHKHLKACTAESPMYFKRRVYASSEVESDMGCVHTLTEASEASEHYQDDVVAVVVETPNVKSDVERKRLVLGNAKPKVATDSVAPADDDTAMKVEASPSPGQVALRIGTPGTAKAATDTEPARRPIKADPAVSRAGMDTPGEPETPEQPVKRKRGRPPKYPKPATLAMTPTTTPVESDAASARKSARSRRQSTKYAGEDFSK